MYFASRFALVILLTFPLPVSALPPTPIVSQVASESHNRIVWERSGGIAGICHRLTIESTGSYILEECIRQQPLRQGQLSRSQFASLQRYLNRYNRFEWELPPTPNSADMFAERYTFNGQGRRSPSAKTKEAMNVLFGEIATQLMQP